MNEELQKQLLEWAKQAMEFTQANVPVVVSQYLTWWTWMHAMGSVLGVLLVAFSYFVSYRLFWKKYAGEDFNDGWTLVAIITGSLTFTTGSIAVVINVFELVKILVAPAVYIIDTFAR